MRLAALAFVCLLAPAAFAADAMRVEQQNELVQKYCAVCHTDAVPRGGLSLEHYDATTAAPSLNAMMLSKLTNGVALKTVQAVPTDAEAAALVNRKMKRGAMGAAGLPMPEQPVIAAFARAFATHGATDKWHTSRQQRVTPASIAAEAPSTEHPGEAAIYRLIVSCDAATGEGSMQLAWSPVPRTGTLAAVADGAAPQDIVVPEGTETIGAGYAAIAGTAAVKFAMPPPAKTLAFSNLFPDQSVVFRFGALASETRQALNACLGD